MKTLKQITAILILSIIIYSFNYKNKEDVIIPNLDKVELLFKNSKIKSQKYNTDVNTKMIIRKVKKETFKKLFNYDPNKIKYVVLFNNGKQILGLGIHYYKDKNYYFNYYKLKDKNFILQESNIAYLTTCVDIYYLNNVFFKQNNKSSIINLFYFDNFLKEKTSRKFNDFSLNIRKKFYKFNNNKEFIFLNGFKNIDPNNPCGEVDKCLQGGGPVCTPNGFYCTTICAEQQLKSILKKQNKKTSFLIDKKYYKLRDDFLLKSNKGKQYIALYYGSYSHIKDVLNYDIISDLVKVFPSINKSIDNLFDNDYKGIIIDTDLKQDIIKIIDKMKKNTKSNTFKQTLNFVKKDLINFSNKNKKEVYELMK